MIYCLINIAMIAISAFLDRRVFAVFGSLGVAGYMGYLSFQAFKDSLLLPLVLTGFGLAVIGVAIWYQKKRSVLEAFIVRSLPVGISRLSPVSRV